MNILLLAAGLEDLISAIFPLIVLVIWVLSQVMGSQPKKKPPPRRQPAGRAPAGGGQVGAGPPAAARAKRGAPNQDLRDQVEKFLQQVSGEQPAAKQPVGGQAAPARGQHRGGGEAVPAEVVPVRRRPAPPPAPQQTQRVRPLPSQVPTPPAQPAPVRSRHAVAEHVQQHLDTSDVGRRVSHLGEVGERADERFQSHLAAAFDHDLGQLAKDDASQVASQSPEVRNDPDSQTEIAQQIADVFRSPQDIRRAIILSEILNRPEDRWE